MMLKMQSGRPTLMHIPPDVAFYPQAIQGLRFGCIQKPKKHSFVQRLWIKRDREAVQWRKGNTVYIVTTAVQGCTKIV